MLLAHPLDPIDLGRNLKLEREHNKHSDYQIKGVLTGLTKWRMIMNSLDQHDSTLASSLHETKSKSTSKQIKNENQTVRRQI